jgi:glycosyltransferase involved in cell wall biosynthesis
MRVCIPIEFKPQGGGHYFLKSFSEYLLAHQHSVTADIRDRYEVLFTNHWMVPRRQILKAIRRNPRVRIVQRIDGAAQDYGRDPEADRIQHEVNLLADLTIFQSEYCRYSTREKFPVIIQDGPVIHNPVDVNLFTPSGKRRSFPQDTLVAAVTWSQNPMKGAASVYAVTRNNPNVGFVLCGNFSDAPSVPNVHALGILSRDELAEALRSCDAMITFSQNEACPNHVLEALASGLPVLYHDSGAMKEVIGDCGEPVTPEDFLSQLKLVLQHKTRYSTAARQRAIKHFAPQRIFPQYLEAINNALGIPTRLPTARRLAIAYMGM